MTARSRVWTLGASLLLTATLAACGSSSTGSGSTSGGGSGGGAGAYGGGAASGGSSSSAPAAGGSASAAAATVMTASSSLGTILVDGSGRTLYLFTKDSPGTSTCTGGCLAVWPPLLGTPTAGTGVDASMLGTLTRPDGKTQVSYKGMPLYYWAQDSAPGQTSGQGVQGVWWVVSPQGTPITTK
ncbi:MAG: hypothetical protein BGO38_10200 [Cellulomonas sp. 73-145]|uniref:COG4315 family predicted lipoprotein n=1 Tax=Cellulomonas sp. 73-145 TaxID=1895739 RepID=UPI00092BAD00|nr:hypothetical protein [Cellulomonas sp. 73-145]MBN9326448.1 hypothetical protein [Cellulomonas sp.]OJV60582.1 MAG: hypothetical protein BGO38_10200 [Cellulomonas sp. 73-145]